MILTDVPMSVIRAASKRVKFGRMELTSDLWDDDKSCDVFIDGKDSGEIIAHMYDAGVTSRVMRVAYYEVDVDFDPEVEGMPAEFLVDAYPDARAALSDAKKYVRIRLAEQMWDTGWRPRGWTAQDELLYDRGVLDLGGM